MSRFDPLLNLRRHNPEVASAPRSAVTASLEQLEVVSPAVGQVVASFSRRPEGHEIASVIEKLTGLEVVPHSAHIEARTTGRHVVVAHVRQRTVERTLDARTGMREISSNVYMDKADQSIWKVQGDKIMLTQTEDLSSLIELATTKVRQARQGRVPEVARVAPVRAYVGPSNTQLVSYVHPETASVDVGVRVGEDHVWSEDNGVTEISQDMVVDTEYLNGQDTMGMELSSVDSTDPQAMVDFYAKVYGFDPAYLDQMADQIRGRSAYQGL